MFRSCVLMNARENVRAWFRKIPIRFQSRSVSPLFCSTLIIGFSTLMKTRYMFMVLLLLKNATRRRASWFVWNSPSLKLCKRLFLHLRITSFIISSPNYLIWISWAGSVSVPPSPVNKATQLPPWTNLCRPSLKRSWLQFCGTAALHFTYYHLLWAVGCKEIHMNERKRARTLYRTVQFG